MKTKRVMMGALAALLFCALAQAQEVRYFSGPQWKLCDQEEVGCIISTELTLTGINNQGQLVGSWLWAQHEGSWNGTGSVLVDIATGKSVTLLPPKPLTNTTDPEGNTKDAIFASNIDNNGIITGGATNFHNRLSPKSDPLEPRPIKIGAVIGTADNLKWFNLRGLDLIHLLSNSNGDLAGMYSFVKNGIWQATSFYKPAKGKIEILGSAWIADINDRGDVLFRGGFLRKDGVTTQLLGYPGALWTSFNGMNNRGDIVGSYTVSVFVPWLGRDIYEEHGFTLIDGVYTTVDEGDPYYSHTNTELNDINDLGQIVGSTDDLRSFVILPPATTTISEAK